MTSSRKTEKSNLTDYRSIKSRPISVVKGSADHHEKMLGTRLRLLCKREPALIDQEDWAIRLDAVEDLAKICTLGEASLEVQRFIAAYLVEVADSGDDEAAKKIIGINHSGRPSEKLYEIRSIAAYELYKGEGFSEDFALREAWNAHYPERDFKTEFNKKAGDGGYTDSYSQSIEKTIKPILKKAGVRMSLPPGRPKKIPKKT